MTEHLEGLIQNTSRCFIQLGVKTLCKWHRCTSACLCFTQFSSHINCIKCLNSVRKEKDAPLIWPLWEFYGLCGVIKPPFYFSLHINEYNGVVQYLEMLHYLHYFGIVSQRVEFTCSSLTSNAKNEIECGFFLWLLPILNTSNLSYTPEKHGFQKKMLNFMQIYILKKPNTNPSLSEETGCKKS